MSKKSKEELMHIALRFSLLLVLIIIGVLITMTARFLLFYSPQEATLDPKVQRVLDYELFNEVMDVADAKTEDRGDVTLSRDPFNDPPVVPAPAPESVP